MIAQRFRTNVVLDGVGGGEPGKFVSKLPLLRDAGYRVEVGLMSAPTNCATERMVARGLKTGRFVRLGTLKGGHCDSIARHLEWRDLDLIDRWRLYDTTARRAKIVAEGGGGEVRILDRERYEATLEKANE